MTTKPVAKAKPMQLCCVSINYHSLLLPADKGMKLVELLQHAVECDSDYKSGLGHVYTVRQQPQVELVLVKPQQVRAAAPDPETDPTAPRRLTAQRPVTLGDL